MSFSHFGCLLIILGTCVVAQQAADTTQQNDDLTSDDYVLQDDDTAESGIIDDDTPESGITDDDTPESGIIDDDTPESGIMEEEAELYAPEVETNSSGLAANLTNSTETAPGVNSSSVFINCTLKENLTQEVELVNSTRLLSMLVVSPLLTRAMAADCLVVLFYARWCPFSSMVAPHFNALPRAFPNLKMAAVDAMKYNTFNTQYGIVGVPTVVLFHNGRPAVRFNDTEYTLEHFSRFITKFTAIPPVEKMFVTSADFQGPVSSVIVKETDYFLVLSWVFLAFSAFIFFTKSSWYRWLVEAVQNTWRESEAQHEHMD